MQTDGVWMKAWLEHAACQLKAVYQFFCFQCFLDKVEQFSINTFIENISPRRKLQEDFYLLKLLSRAPKIHKGLPFLPRNLSPRFHTSYQSYACFPSIIHRFPVLLNLMAGKQVNPWFSGPIFPKKKKKKNKFNQAVVSIACLLAGPSAFFFQFCGTLYFFGLLISHSLMKCMILSGIWGILIMLGENSRFYSSQAEEERVPDKLTRGQPCWITIPHLVGVVQRPIHSMCTQCENKTKEKPIMDCLHGHHEESSEVIERENENERKTIMSFGRDKVSEHVKDRGCVIRGGVSVSSRSCSSGMGHLGFNRISLVCHKPIGQWKRVAMMTRGTRINICLELAFEVCEVGETVDDDFDYNGVKSFKGFRRYIFTPIPSLICGGGCWTISIESNDRNRIILSQVLIKRAGWTCPCPASQLVTSQKDTGNHVKHKHRPKYLESKENPSNKESITRQWGSILVWIKSNRQMYFNSKNNEKLIKKKRKKQATSIKRKKIIKKRENIMNKGNQEWLAASLSSHIWKIEFQKQGGGYFQKQSKNDFLGFPVGNKTVVGYPDLQSEEKKQLCWNAIFLYFVFDIHQKPFSCKVSKCNLILTENLARLEFKTQNLHRLKSKVLSGTGLTKSQKRIHWDLEKESVQHCKKPTQLHAVDMQKLPGSFYFTVPKHLHMQTSGVWLTAWLEHAACLQAPLEQWSDGTGWIWTGCGVEGQNIFQKSLFLLNNARLKKHLVTKSEPNTFSYEMVNTRLFPACAPRVYMFLGKKKLNLKSTRRCEYSSQAAIQTPPVCICRLFGTVTKSWTSNISFLGLSAFQLQAVEHVPIPLYESLRVVMIMLSGVGLCSSLRLISYAAGRLEPSNPDINNSTCMNGHYMNNLPTIDFNDQSHECLLSSSEPLHKALGHPFQSEARVMSARGLINKFMLDYCNKKLICTRYSNAYTPQQNGLAERFIRTIIESVREILKDSGRSLQFWSEIIKASTLTLNQISSHRSRKSPFELFKNRSLPLDYFKPIGLRVSY
ncbi:hypothetical protein VP01_2000g1 [Puccinia sorghi]|uniref:Integrase catalytic domain-containing protein n=1 Tax=Puccinia sorghi TaxID=27349 RepID=A0A0L6VD85_9BASI|nr:hypothetical protein VP01_2000g1 [Puccinia sorghi]